MGSQRQVDSSSSQLFTPASLCDHLNLTNMLRLIIATVLASACLAYPQRREGGPADAAQLQGFDQGMPNMQQMQGMPMQAMPAGQFLPFNPNMGMPYKRAEDLETRRQHSMFNGDSDNAAFQPEDGLENIMDFMKDTSNDNLPFNNMDGAAADLGQFAPNAESEDGKYRFFNKEQ